MGEADTVSTMENRARQNLQQTRPCFQRGEIQLCSIYLKVKVEPIEEFHHTPSTIGRKGQSVKYPK